MILAPLALYQMFSQRSWLALAVSVGLYAFAQAYSGASGWPVDRYHATWQVFFFVGLVIGFHRAELSRALARKPWLRDGAAAVVLLVAVVFTYMHIRGNYLWPGLPRLVLGQENKIAMGPLRLSLVALYLLTFYILTAWFWKPLNTLLGWLLIPLGSASLWTFTWQLIVIVLLYNIPAFYRQDEPWQGTFWQALGVLIIWGSIQGYRWLRRRIAPQG